MKLAMFFGVLSFVLTRVPFAEDTTHVEKKANADELAVTFTEIPSSPRTCPVMLNNGQVATLGYKAGQVEVRFHDASNGKMVQTRTVQIPGAKDFTQPHTYFPPALSRDGNYLAIRESSESKELKLFNTKNGQLVKSFPAGGSNSMSFSDDNTRMLVKDISYNTSYLYSLPDGKQIGPAIRYATVEFRSGGHELNVMANSEKILHYDPPAKAKLVGSTPKDVHIVTPSGNGQRFLALGTHGGASGVIDTDTGVFFSGIYSKGAHSMGPQGNYASFKEAGPGEGKLTFNSFLNSSASSAPQSFKIENYLEPGNACMTWSADGSKFLFQTPSHSSAKIYSVPVPVPPAIPATEAGWQNLWQQYREQTKQTIALNSSLSKMNAKDFQSLKDVMFPTVTKDTFQSLVKSLDSKVYKERAKASAQLLARGASVYQDVVALLTPTSKERKAASLSPHQVQELDVLRRKIEGRDAAIRHVYHTSAGVAAAQPLREYIVTQMLPPTWHEVAGVPVPNMPSDTIWFP